MLKNKIKLILEDDLLNNKKISNKLTSKFYSKYHFELYTEIIEYGNKYNIEKISEIIYCILNDITKIPKCIVCNNKNKTYKNFNIGYKKTCGNKYCYNNIQETKDNNQLKIKETLNKKYGITNISQLKEIKEKKENTMLKNYGVKFNSQRLSVKENISNNMTNVNLKKNSDKRYNLLSNIKNINIVNLYNKNNKYLTDLQCLKCNNIFSISQHLAQDRYISKYDVCIICNPINKYYSKGEKEILNFIQENYNGEIIENSRSIIQNNELDIYLPELNLAFEFNGTYWHSELYKNKNYHLNKTEKCINKNIHLIHIFQDDWEYKSDIIKSRILNLLNKSNKIYARKCNIKIVSNKDKIQFLNTNHIQGNCVSKYNLGLYFNNELVSLMTFGERKITGSFNMELLRFCNKLNTTIVGGASKLFKYFINNYEYINIISYADRSWSNGNLYEQLGFTFIKNTTPNYYWIMNGLKENRFNFRKDKLIKNNLLIEGETEVSCMHRLGYYRIYDSGSLVFEWKNKNKLKGKIKIN